MQYRNNIHTPLPVSREVRGVDSVDPQADGDARLAAVG